MFELPTKERCDFIVKNSNQFFKKEEIIFNKSYNVYHYKQANYEEFEKYNAFELRGLTFIKEENIWKRFPSIHKFFELNQAPRWMEEDLKDKKVIKAVEKIDGSFIQPILIDEEIVFKTKLSFTSYQAQRANEIIKRNPHIKEYILKKFKENKIPLFEYISPKTQVVINYTKEELILIQVRDLKTGDYDLEFEKEAKQKGIRYAKKYDIENIEEFIKIAENRSNIEGWILIFEDSHFVKIKTKEYLKRYEMLKNFYPNKIIRAILDKKEREYEKILNKKSEKYRYFKEIEAIFNEKYHHLKKEAQKSSKLPYKIFKKRYKNHPYYELLSLYRNKGINEFNEWIRLHTTKLKGAKKFLNIK